MISSTKYPTTNIYFPQICEIKMNLSKWVNFPNEVIHQIYIERKKRARTSTMKTKLDHYLEEEYPTLQEIARDVLVILISTIAFESAFSIGGQILTPHRSRLHYTTLEALMCSKSWLWNSENASSRSIEESTFTDEIESDDEGGSLVNSIT
ncbi:putative AC transposase [Glycine max]|nr:putative AC transposase [Glycine max]